jgi:hypothetical protein
MLSTYLGQVDLLVETGWPFPGFYEQFVFILEFHILVELCPSEKLSCHCLQ